MSSTSVTIKTAVNGFIVEYRDPEIEAKNRGDGPWIDPYRSVVCKDGAEVGKLVEALIPCMINDEKEDVVNEYDSALKEALKEISK